jgi:hypothetical protein
VRAIRIGGYLLLLAVYQRSFSQTQIPREWLLTTDIYGNSLHQRLTMFVKGEDVTGTLDGDALIGKVSGNHIHFVATDKRKNTTEVNALFDEDKMTGEMSVTFSNAPKEHVHHNFSGEVLKERPAGPPTTVEFKPTKFYNRFSAEIALF